MTSVFGSGPPDGPAEPGLFARLRRYLAGPGVINPSQALTAAVRADAMLNEQPVQQVLAERYSRVPATATAAAGGPIGVPIVYFTPDPPGPPEPDGHRRPPEGPGAPGPLPAVDRQETARPVVVGRPPKDEPRPTLDRPTPDRPAPGRPEPGPGAEAPRREPPATTRPVRPAEPGARVRLDPLVAPTTAGRPPGRDQAMEGPARDEVVQPRREPVVARPGLPVPPGRGGMPADSDGVPARPVVEPGRNRPPGPLPRPGDPSSPGSRPPLVVYPVPDGDPGSDPGPGRPDPGRRRPDRPLGSPAREPGIERRSPAPLPVVEPRRPIDPTGGVAAPFEPGAPDGGPAPTNRPPGAEGRILPHPLAARQTFRPDSPVPAPAERPDDDRDESPEGDEGVSEPRGEGTGGGARPGLGPRDLEQIVDRVQRQMTMDLELQRERRGAVRWP